MYVPNYRLLKLQLIQDHYKAPAVGHPGCAKKDPGTAVMTLLLAQYVQGY